MEKARSKTLQPHEYNSGIALVLNTVYLKCHSSWSWLKLSYTVVDTGTFTLSNLGMFGVDRFDAILPPGQVSFQILETFLLL